MTAYQTQAKFKKKAVAIGKRNGHRKFYEWIKGCSWINHCKDCGRFVWVGRYGRNLGCYGGNAITEKCD